MPASEMTTDFEREYPDLVRELRLLPTAAPDELRGRVRALGEPQAKPRRSISRRRAVLVIAPACALALIAAAVVHGIVSSSPARKESAGAVRAKPHAATLGKTTRKSPRREVFQATLAAPFDQVPPPGPGRYRDYDAYLRLRVKDLDALGEKTADAMRLTQQLGGYVASLEQSTSAGAPGEADLVLRVPVAHVQQALVQLSTLGTVLEQHLSITDLNRVVAAQRQRILQLKVQIARITAALQQSLPADVRLRLQFQLDAAKRNLTQATGANKSTLRAAAMSRVSLYLTTQRAAAVPTKHHRGIVGRAVHGAFRFLTGAGAVALAALIVLAPVLVLVMLSLWAVRAYRRRDEQRLLAAP
jgi:uncharacterized coiled-coil protein SlyX